MLVLKWSSVSIAEGIGLASSRDDAISGHRGVAIQMQRVRPMIIGRPQHLTASLLRYPHHRPVH
jgi:hypothetical protein